jgi:hypothetical protein
VHNERGEAPRSRHVVLDGLLAPRLLTQAWFECDDGRLEDGPLLRQLREELRSDDFCAFLEQLTGLRRVEAADDEARARGIRASEEWAALDGRPSPLSATGRHQHLGWKEDGCWPLATDVSGGRVLARGSEHRRRRLHVVVFLVLEAKPILSEDQCRQGRDRTNGVRSGKVAAATALPPSKGWGRGRGAGSGPGLRLTPSFNRLIVADDVGAAPDDALSLAACDLGAEVPPVFAVHIPFSSDGRLY